MRGYTDLLEKAERYGITVDEVIENQWDAAEDENDRRRDAECELAVVDTTKEKNE